MRYILLILLISLSSILYSQDDARDHKHEIKLNALLVILGNPELNYEYILTRNTGAGLYANVNLDNNKLYPYNYMFGGYYRFYVGKKTANGFFFEAGLAAIGLSVESYYYYDQTNGNYYYEDEDYHSYGPTITLGGKFPLGNSVLLEFFGGIGRNFSSEEMVENVFPRIGISIGHRF